jgi:hypothetical protein
MDKYQYPIAATVALIIMWSCVVAILAFLLVPVCDWCMKWWYKVFERGDPPGQA